VSVGLEWAGVGDSPKNNTAMFRYSKLPTFWQFKPGNPVRLV